MLKFTHKMLERINLKQVEKTLVPRWMCEEFEKQMVFMHNSFLPPILKKAKCREIRKIIVDDHGMFLDTFILSKKDSNNISMQAGCDNFKDLQKWLDHVFGLPFFGYLIDWEL